MNVYAAASCAACISYLGLIVFHLQRERHSAALLNYILLLLCFVIYSGFYIPFSMVLSERSAVILYRAASVGWCVFPGLMLCFTADLVLNGRMRSHIFIAAVLPGVCFAAYSCVHGMYVASFKRVVFFGHLHLYPVADGAGPATILFIIYICVMITQSLIFLVMWRLRAESKAERISRSLVLLSGGAVFVLNLVTNAVLPILGLPYLPDMGHITSLIFFSSIACCSFLCRQVIFPPYVEMNDSE